MPSHLAAATLIAADVRRRAWLSQTAAIRSRIVVPVSPYAASKQNCALAGLPLRVSEGTRTPDRLDHNQELYQLSYAHRGTAESTSVPSRVHARRRTDGTPPAGFEPAANGLEVRCSVH